MLRCILLCWHESALVRCFFSWLSMLNLQQKSVFIFWIACSPVSFATLFQAYSRSEVAIWVRLVWKLCLFIPVVTISAVMCLQVLLFEYWPPPGGMERYFLSHRHRSYELVGHQLSSLSPLVLCASAPSMCFQDCFNIFGRPFPISTWLYPWAQHQIHKEMFTAVWCWRTTPSSSFGMNCFIIQHLLLMWLNVNKSPQQVPTSCARNQKPASAV